MTRGVRRLLYGELDPYAGFDPASVPEAKLETWWPESALALERLISDCRPRLAVEVGSWLGWSASILARAMREREDVFSELELVCVDTWLGSAEMVSRQTPENRAFLHRKHGLPQVYWHFLANMKREGLAEIVTPYAQTSRAAAQVFAGMGLRFDLIYLDAAHDFETVFEDLFAWAGLLKPSAILAGDDFDPVSDPGVVEAVQLFADRAVRLDGRRLELTTEGRTWRLR